MANDNEILMGGREITITKAADNSTSTVKIKKVSHLRGAKLVEAYGDDAALASLVSGLSEEELSDLTEDSFYDIVDTGHEINDKTLTRALESQSKKLQNPAFQKMFQQASTLTSFSPGSTEKS